MSALIFLIVSCSKQIVTFYENARFQYVIIAFIIEILYLYSSVTSNTIVQRLTMLPVILISQIYNFMLNYNL